MLQGIGILITLLLAVCIPAIFTEEHTRKTDQLILCSQYGKQKLFGAKVITAVSFTMGTAVLFILSLVIPAFIVYGTDGFDSQLQLSLPTAAWKLSRGQMTLILIGLCLIASLLKCAAAVFLAEKTKNNVTVMAVMLGFVLLCMFLHIPDQYRTASQIYSFMPLNAVSVIGAFGPRMVYAFGNYWTAWQTSPVVYVVLTAVLLIMGKWQYTHYQVQ